MHEPPQPTQSTRLFAGVNIAFGILLIASTLLGGIVFSMNKKFGPAIFLYWLRHLTNWNAILSALWFILIGAFARQLDAKPLIVLGIITVLLNSFVFFVRWGWFKIQPLRTNPSLVFCDVIIHALVPLAQLVSIVVMFSNVPNKLVQSSVAQGILGFWVIVILWYALNYALVKSQKLPWPYTNGAGVSLPRDIYSDQCDQKRPYLAYMTLNFIIALLISMLCLMAVYGSK